MVTGTYPTRSLLPWQAFPYRYPGFDHADNYRVYLHNAGELLIGLYLQRSDTTGRWYISLFDFTQGKALNVGQLDGYSRPHLAERALMFALHRHLHPKNAPPHLPPSPSAAISDHSGREVT